MPGVPERVRLARGGVAGMQGSEARMIFSRLSVSLSLFFSFSGRCLETARALICKFYIHCMNVTIVVLYDIVNITDTLRIRNSTLQLPLYFYKYLC